MREGRHDFYFTGGGKVSRHTRVDIQFDNAAPTATLDAPAARALEPGDALTISGMALPGCAQANVVNPSMNTKLPSK